MDDGDRGRRGELTELRFRLYRRDPPVGAVEAYLTALAHAPHVLPPEPVRAPARARRRHRPRRPPPVRALVGAAAVLTAAVAVAVLLPVAMRQLSTLTAITGPEPTAVATIPFPPAAGTPLGTMAGGPAVTSRFAAGGSIVVAGVSCAGHGTVTIRIARDRPTVLTCDTEVPAYALLQSASALDRFAITVEPGPQVRWSLTVGTLRALRPASAGGPAGG